MFNVLDPFLADQEDAITVGPVLPSESVEVLSVCIIVLS